MTLINSFHAVAHPRPNPTPGVAGAFTMFNYWLFVGVAALPDTREWLCRDETIPSKTDRCLDALRTSCPATTEVTGTLLKCLEASEGIGLHDHSGYTLSLVRYCEDWGGTCTGFCFQCSAIPNSRGPWVESNWCWTLKYYDIGECLINAYGCIPPETTTPSPTSASTASTSASTASTSASTASTSASTASTSVSTASETTATTGSTGTSA